MTSLCGGNGGGCVLLSARDLAVAEEVEDEQSVRFGARNDSEAFAIAHDSRGQ